MNTTRKRAGSEVQYGPRPVGEILHNYLENGNEPLPVAYRQHKLSECVYPHTELGIDLKLLMQTPGRPPVGAMLDGTLVHDSDEHFLFTEKVIGKKVKTAQRNPVIFAGGCVNVHLLADGTKRPELCRPRFNSDLSFCDFCIAAAQELLTIARLFKEENSEE